MHADETPPSHGLIMAALQFLQAVRDDDTAGALALLDAHPSITGLSIRTAAAAGDLTAVRRHLAADASCATRSIPPDHTPPLVYAVRRDVKQARGVSPDEHLALVRALLDAGADPNASVALPDRAARIPVLYFPSVAGDVSLARLLLERGAAPTDGESVYHAAQHDQREILALLHAFGADLSHGPAGTGNSPLHFLTSHRVSNPTSASAMRGLAWLLEHGADPMVPLSALGDGQLPSQLGETPLHRAAASGHGADVLAQLVRHGAAVNATRDDGATAYTMALRAGNSAAVRWLADAGADVTKASPTDRLLYACLTADATAARALVAAHPHLVAQLGDDDARAIFVAMLDERHEALQLMLSLGWPLHHQSEWGGTPLHWAAWNGQVALVEQLLDADAPVNARDTRYGSSPIAWAAHGSCFSPRSKGTEADRDYAVIVRRLLDSGATREEAVNRWGEPPETLGSDAVVTVLRERGWVG